MQQSDLRPLTMESSISRWSIWFAGAHTVEERVCDEIGVASAAIMTTAVLVTNCAVALWAYLRLDLVDGVGTAIEGSCKNVSAWNFGRDRLSTRVPTT